MTTTVIDGLRFPEGVRWHDGAVWFSDIAARTVHRFPPGGALETVIRFDDDEPSGIGFLPDGTPLVVLMWTRRLVRINGGRAELHADLGPLPGGMLNDMVVDAAGRAYIDNRNPTESIPSPLRPEGRPADPEGDGIILVRPDGSSEIAAHATHPNGLAVTPDGSTLIVAETRESRLAAFRIGADGSLSDRRVFAQLASGTPDGITLDAAGAVWAGSPHTNEFLRIAEGGEVLQRIPLGDRWGVSCALGDADRRTLYLATLTTESIATLRTPGGCAGAIESARVDAPGAGLP
jgi:sugar lactone lactonase YvrE